MNQRRPSFLNLTLDHSTFLVDPALYPVYYTVWFRVLLGLSREDIIYNVRSKDGKKSMTFAAQVGSDDPQEDHTLKNTLQAFVQPTESVDEQSHVRESLIRHRTSILCQHQALRTSDLITLYDHMKKHGVNFITPILIDEQEDLLQVFTGEIFVPEELPSGVFFEFVQRKVTLDLKRRVQMHHRETFFRDDTFLGLYAIKEQEHRSGKITPLIDHELFLHIEDHLAGKKLWEITEDDIASIKAYMLRYAALKQ